MIVLISVHVSNYKILLLTGTGFIHFVVFGLHMVNAGQLRKTENKVIPSWPILNEMLL